MKIVFDSVIKVDVLTSRSIPKIIKKKPDALYKHLERPMFVRSPDPVLHRTEQVRQALRAVLSFKTYGYENQLVWQLFFRLSPEGHCANKFLIGGQYLESILKSIARRRRSIWKIRSPSTFEALNRCTVYHWLVLVLSTDC